MKTKTSNLARWERYPFLSGFGTKDIVDSGTYRSFENQSFAPDESYELYIRNKKVSKSINLRI
jgi:hypothetical protein